MRVDVPNKSRSLMGVSDLTLTAPIKRGLIASLDSRSYESRLRLLFRTLNTLRVSSREAEPTPLIADAVDRIRAIHSFRLAIVGEEPSRQLLLAVAFDGGWEQYMRRIWRDLGPLLDVIFCNCDGYLTSHDHGYPEYANWVRRAEVDTEFFYNATSSTVSDLHYLRNTARIRIDGASPPAAPPVAIGELIGQALPAITALYRLTDMYPPRAAVPTGVKGPDDGECLRRAARSLMTSLVDRPDRPVVADPTWTPVEKAAWEWFAPAPAAAPPQPSMKKPDLGNVQRGIAERLDGVVYGCLVLIALENAAAVRALIDLWTSLEKNATGDADKPFVSIGFTFQGLKVAEVPSGTLDQMPFEFREGMAARAGILGDLRHNHPLGWKLPQRNWQQPPQHAEDRVELTSVHAVVQFACKGEPTMDWKEFTTNHPLWLVVHAFGTPLQGEGVRILSVQAMQRFVEALQAESKDHFGFEDGFSQPLLEDVANAEPYSDKVMPGDLFLGYENSLHDKPMTGRLWDDSTFLVIRKLRQDVGALEAAVQGPDANLAKAKMMGRWPNGNNLINNVRGNAFDFSGDPDGAKCPFQSHVRRANPRGTRPDMKSVPRIMRRGMSYGPRYSPSTEAEERGIVFMAYCASIAEQFEVIQAWLSGGNSSGPHIYSGLRDPFLGVAQDDDPQIFRYVDNDQQKSVTLSPQRPLVKLQWGAYVFVPSRRAMAELREIAREAAEISAEDQEAAQKEGPAKELSRKENQRKVERSVQAQKGAALIARLRYLEQTMGPETARTQWKIALEDVSARMSGMSRFIWTAIREHHQGALRTPYGVLVASKKLVLEVFANQQKNYTVTGYAKRMDKSFGSIYLGMDIDDGYVALAKPCNAAIESVSESEAFDSALQCTQATLDALLAGKVDADVDVDVKDIVDGALAGISKHWFGVPDGTFVKAGGWHWQTNGTPTCPGHFHSPSRYMFQPNPGPEAEIVGQQHGQALREAVEAFVRHHRSQGSVPSAPLAEALFEVLPGAANHDIALLARTLIGVMMGFLPTVDGNLRGLLYEWVYDRSLWDHEITYHAVNGNAYEKAKAVLLAPLRRTLQLRPVPELVWRTARKSHRLGSADVNVGDVVVVSIVSATQQGLLDDDDDLFPLFGGERKRDTAEDHACPGYRMAMGVMLGVLAGMLQHARLRPTLSPMVLRMTLR